MSGCCGNRDIVLPSGSDGVGIVDVDVNGSNQLVITLSDGSTVTTGAITITDTGSIIIHNDNAAETTDVYTAGTPVQVGTKTYTIPAATLSTNGSQARITAWLTKNMTVGTARDIIWLYVNGAWFVAPATYPGVQSTYLGDAQSKIKVEMTLTRVSNTSINVDFCGSVYGFLGIVPDYGETGHQALDPVPLGAFNFTTTGIVVAVFAQSFDATDVNITCDRFTVEKILK